MEWWWLLIVGGLLLGPIIGGAFHTASDTSAFADLGDIQGMPIADIIAKVGQPNSISSVPDGTLYQWQAIIGASGYHYAILVDADEKAVGYTHQHVG